MRAAALGALAVALLAAWAGSAQVAPETAPRPEKRPAAELEARSDTAPAIRPVAGAQDLSDWPQVSDGRLCGDPRLSGSPIRRIRPLLPGCGLRQGVAITSAAGVALSDPVRVDCRTAVALADWIEAGLTPAFEDLAGGAAGLEIAAGYTCRPRYGREGARISEHGRGRAVDISGIVLADGTSVSLLEGWDDPGAGPPLKAAHRAACGVFSTVLGPEANAAHRDHFHFDTARGRGIGSYCR